MALEFAINDSGLGALARRLLGGRVTILAYHNVVCPGDTGRGDASLHLPLAAFRQQIEWLQRTHCVVDLDTAATTVDSRRPLAVVTFDDAYRGAVTIALPELMRRGLPATVFVSPGLLGASSTWWDELAEVGLLSHDVRRSALVDLGGRADVVRERVLGDRHIPTLPASLGIATAAELQRYCRDGIAVGSHAWGHEHLPSLDADALAGNLTRTLDWLRSFGPNAVPWLALPYGAASTVTERIALRLGHAGVLRIAGGRWGKGRERRRIPRINVPAGLSLRGLALRASGFLA